MDDTLRNRLRILGGEDYLADLEAPSVNIPISVIVGISNEMHLSIRDRNWLMLGGARPKPAKKKSRMKKVG